MEQASEQNEELNRKLRKTELRHNKELDDQTRLSEELQFQVEASA